MQSQTVMLPGINIQAPWAEAIVSGRKLIETRFYPMPRKWIGQPLAIIETPGQAGVTITMIPCLVFYVLLTPVWIDDGQPSPAIGPGPCLIQTTGCSDGGRTASPSGRGLCNGSKPTSSRCLPVFVRAFVMRAPWRFSDHRRRC